MAQNILGDAYSNGVVSTEWLAGIKERRSKDDAEGSKH